MDLDPETIYPLDPGTPPSAQATHDDCAGDGPFVAAEFYLWDRPLVDAFRKQIVTDAKGWLAVEKAISAAGLELGEGSPLKRMPRGFEDQAGSALDGQLKKDALARRP